MLGVVVVYLGLIATFLGGVSLLRPLTFLAIHSRRQAALTSLVSSTPSGFQRRKRRCIAPSS